MAKKILTFLRYFFFLTFTYVGSVYYIVAVSSVAVKKAVVADEESDDKGQLKRKARPSRKSATGNKIV